jgi:hypothetical protein
VVLRCRSCGARLSLDDYYQQTQTRPAAPAANDEELEKSLANVPVNRL